MLRTRCARGKIVRTEMGTKAAAEVLTSRGPSISVAEQRTRRWSPFGSLMISEGLSREERVTRTSGKVRPESGWVGSVMMT